MAEFFNLKPLLWTFHGGCQTVSLGRPEDSGMYDPDSIDAMAEASRGGRVIAMCRECGTLYFDGPIAYHSQPVEIKCPMHPKCSWIRYSPYMATVSIWSTIIFLAAKDQLVVSVQTDQNILRRNNNANTDSLRVI